MNKYSFFISVWNKYLSAIRILLKKSAKEDQVLGMNRMDFERAVGIRKSGYRFVVNYIDGKPDALYSGNDLVQTFISALANDETIHSLLVKYNYTFTFTSKYQLQIKNNSSPVETEQLVQAEEESLIN